MAEILPASQQEQPPQNNGWERAVQIFTDPVPAFQALRSQPSWLLPLIIVLLVSSLTSYLTTSQQIELQREMINNSTIIPENRKADMLESLETQGFFQKKVLPIIGVIFRTLVAFLVVAAALQVFGNFIYGGENSFRSNFALYSWSGLIGALGMLVKLPLILINDTLLVQTSPAVLLDASRYREPLFQLLDALDIFTVWKIIVLLIGFAIFYRVSTQKAAVAVVSLYVVYVAINIGISQLF